ncbi:ribonuclease H-like domain-containing protein [Tanacetum coccineum]
MGNKNPIRTLGDYSKPSHEGYRNTIELPVGNNVVPLRFDTIRLVQNGCSFHRTSGGGTGGKLNEPTTMKNPGHLKVIRPLWTRKLETQGILQAESRKLLASRCPDGSHDTQYCMEDPKRAFVEYASSRTNTGEVSGVYFSTEYKARLVANGRSQQFGVDCDDTFSHVVKPATVYTVLSLALSRNWPIHQLDVKNAFLNSDLSETMYMYQPPGYANRDGFSLSRCDSSLFIYQHGSEVAYLLIYVDDIILTASSMDLLQRIISSLHKEFDMTDLGALNYFLGIFVTRDSTGKTQRLISSLGE